MTRNTTWVLSLLLLAPSCLSFAPKLFLKQHVAATRRLATKADDDVTSSSGADNDSFLPDYGKTSVEVDKIRLQKKWRRKDLDGSSLVEQTLRELENDSEFQQVASKLEAIGQEGMSREERTKRRRALDALGVPSFGAYMVKNGCKDELTRSATPEVLQINIGLYCNQACAHCHVESSPMRKDEQMTADTAARCLELLRNTPSITTLDITGGAPELMSYFRYMVEVARAMRPNDLDIIDRCNLTVLQEPGQEDLVDFLKKHNVHVVASLPCYSAENVNTQRGGGVFERSIAALLALNEAGYGHEESGLKLDLVYNPLGAFLPPPQAKLQAKYKEVLDENFGILFNELFTITNMPVKRFADFLYKRDELKDYMDLLVRNFNTDAAKNLMCRNTISVGFDGKMYDCDFNQQLGMAIGSKGIHDGSGLSVFDVDSLTDLQKYRIRVDNHCFGCTAGMGSS